MPSIPKSTHSAASLASIAFAFACVYLFWGSTYTAIRIGSQQLPAFLLSGVRFLVAGSILLLVCRFRGLRIRLPFATMAGLAVIGFFLLAGGNVSLVYAEKSIPSGLASLIFAATPIYVALLEMLLPRGEPLSRRGWLGVVLGFAGIVTLLAPDLTSLAHDGIFTDTPRTLGIVARMDTTLADVRLALPHVLNTPELRFDCDDKRKFEVVAEVAARLAAEGANVSEIDGVRVLTEDGWWLLRSSNTQAVLVARCEASSEAGLERLKSALAAQLEASGLAAPDFSGENAGH